MSDLISRSRAIENIWDVFNSYANDSQRFDEYETEAINNAFTVLQKTIEGQPTAYDLDKVVEELEVERERARVGSIEAVRRGMAINSDKHLIKKHSFEKAIDIVRKGGVE